MDARDKHGHDGEGRTVIAEVADIRRAASLSVVRRVVHGLIHRPGLQGTRPKLIQAVPGDLDIFLGNVAAETGAPVLQRGDHRGADTHVRIEHRVTGPRQREDQTFNEFDRKLARMDRLRDSCRADCTIVGRPSAP